MEKFYCPNCGHEVEKGTQFCGHCGYNIADYLKQSPEKKGAQNDKTAAKEQPSHRITEPSTKTPMSKKAKIGWSVGILAVLLLFSGYLFGKNYYSANKQLNRMITAISTNGDLTKYVETDDPSLKVTAKNLKPTQKYFKKHKAQLSQLKSGLTTSGSYHNFQFKQDGRYLLAFPKYKLKIAPAYITLATNHSGTDFYQGKKKLYTSTANKKSFKAGPYFPGSYNFKTQGVISGHHMQNSVTQVLNDQENNGLNLALKTISFTVKGNPGSMIYLNGDNIAKIDQTGKYRVNDQPADGSVLVHLEYPVKANLLDLKPLTCRRNCRRSHYLAPQRRRFPQSFQELLASLMHKSYLKMLFLMQRTTLMLLPTVLKMDKITKILMI